MDREMRLWIGGLIAAIALLGGLSLIWHTDTLTASVKSLAIVVPLGAIATAFLVPAIRDNSAWLFCGTLTFGGAAAAEYFFPDPYIVPVVLLAGGILTVLCFSGVTQGEEIRASNRAVIEMNERQKHGRG